ncbi:UNVERIFIED_CONTAM: hypothetical protein RF649_12980 [Kocuria sp. CPCC 205295]|uniref:hypothetical protein n=1 Tax=Kocuria sp. CPCC 205295 TaxID=3073557 RepID=UPI0036DB7191
MPTPFSASGAHLVEADDPGLADVAYAMFTRNAGTYADPHFTQLAWLDPDIRDFWIQQALAVRDDLECLARRGHL